MNVHGPTAADFGPMTFYALGVRPSTHQPIPSYYDRAAFSRSVMHNDYWLNHNSAARGVDPHEPPQRGGSGGSIPLSGTTDVMSEFLWWPGLVDVYFTMILGRPSALTSSKGFHRCKRKGWTAWTGFDHWCVCFGKIFLKGTDHSIVVTYLKFKRGKVCVLVCDSVPCGRKLQRP